MGLYPVVTGIPTTAVSYNSKFTLQVTVGYTTPTGINLRGSYTYWYRVGDSAWVGLGSSAAVPLTVYAGAALFSYPPGHDPDQGRAR